MTGYMRLRQVCLVAPHLEPVVGDLAAIFGLDVCYRDPHVGKYGLENALLPVDTTLLEVVAPFQDGTAAGRFLQRTGNRGGYMAIFACDDPDARGRHAATLGVRTANVIDHPPYHGVQLHPRDCRAAFIEFNHTEGSDNIRGPYPPAGPDWQTSIRTDVTRSLLGVELQSPDPAGLARHWGAIIGAPVSAADNGDSEIVLVNGRLRFVAGPDELMIGVTMQVRDVSAVLSAAKAKGHPIDGNSVHLGGVAFRLTD
ncbi:hypothetical protein ACWX0K_08305 [Nitrobacteraceae bacterium UC4446_H13]